MPIQQASKIFEPIFALSCAIRFAGEHMLHVLPLPMLQVQSPEDVIQISLNGFRRRVDVAEGIGSGLHLCFLARPGNE
jgi:hypothetical protein